MGSAYAGGLIHKETIAVVLADEGKRGDVREQGKTANTPSAMTKLDQAHEVVRDLVRAGVAAVRSLRQARQRLPGFLLRHGLHYNRPDWTLMHRRWLADLHFEQPAHYLVLEDCLAVIELATGRRDCLEAYIEGSPCGLVARAIVRAL